MIKNLLFLALLLFKPFTLSAQSEAKSSLPLLLIGLFTDDYGIHYEINDTLWIQHPNIEYHIISVDSTEQYLLAYNHEKNESDPGLYTRIDFMKFENMEPFIWGFCLTTYNAPTIEEARDKASADRNNARIGCNGHPFSRMKRSDL